MPVPFNTNKTEPFTLREARCRHCSRIFYVCRYCDRGQAYCSVECRITRQKTIRQRANRRHQTSREGRRDHADRQRRYRLRKKVTDKGRLSLEESDKVCPPGQDSAMIAADMLSQARRFDGSTSCSDSGIPGKDPAFGQLGEQRIASSGATPGSSCPQSGRLDSTRGASALGSAAPICCACCGRAGKFVRVGPLRRLRIRK
jgi:hypothetical protein